MAHARTTSRGDNDARSAVIGRHSRVRGRVTGDSDLVIEGSVEGDVTLRGRLTLSEGGTLTSQVDADGVVVSGTLDGDVVSRGSVLLTSTARVHGDVRGESFGLEDGAEFVGRVEIDFELPRELMEMSGSAARRNRASN